MYTPQRIQQRMPRCSPARDVYKQPTVDSLKVCRHRDREREGSSRGAFYRATAKHTHGIAIDDVSVCPSVCLPDACIVTKRDCL